MIAPREFAFRDVVIVADILDASTATDDFHNRRDLEQTETTTLQALKDAIGALGLRSHHYRDPRELSENASRHRDDIVWSIYGGENSRNRMALVPAICETHHLNYVGLDVYGRIICQDKEISKRLASDCGLTTPPYRLLRSERDLNVIGHFPLPFVIKPLMEGSSIGISQQNLVHESNNGIALARDLLSTFTQPVMVEGFVGGREVSYCSIEANPVAYWSLAEVTVTGREDYFEDHLFDAEEKQFRRLPRDVRTIDGLLLEADRAPLERFLSTLGRYGYCRVDGKLYDGHFVFLEVSPDAWIAPRGAFAQSFTNKGWSYTDVIAAVLSSAAIGPPNPPSNG
jgi:D-alanine-D-alanine ligase